jgi:hypothetical protein
MAMRSASNRAGVRRASAGAVLPSGESGTQWSGESGPVERPGRRGKPSRSQGIEKRGQRLQHADVIIIEPGYFLLGEYFTIDQAPVD